MFTLRALELVTFFITQIKEEEEGKYHVKDHQDEILRWFMKTHFYRGEEYRQ